MDSFNNPQQSVQNSQTPQCPQENFWKKHVTVIDITAGVLIVALVMLSVFFELRYEQIRVEFEKFNAQTAQYVQDNQVLDFTQLFIDEVLKAEGEIDFETRLRLESSVRELNSEEILLIWQNFVGAPSEKAAQDAVKELLSVLIREARK